MTLLTVVKDVCADVGVEISTAVVPVLNTNRTMVEMFAMANEMAQRITADLRDWTELRTLATLVGDGVKTAFDLPADYRRMLLTTNMWGSSSTQTPMRFVPDPDEWLQRRNAAWVDNRGEWTLYGGQVHIVPAMPIGATATFMYLNKSCVILASGGRGTVFADDADRFVLDERLLKLGMIAEWRMKKGAPYAEAMGTYQDAMANAMGSDKPSPIMVGNMPASAGTRTSYPFPVSGPDWPLS